MADFLQQLDWFPMKRKLINDEENKAITQPECER